MPEQRLTTSSLYRQCRWLFLSNLRSRIACFRFANRYSFWGTGQPAAISFQPTANSGLTFCATSGDNLISFLGVEMAHNQFLVGRNDQMCIPEVKRIFHSARGLTLSDCLTMVEVV